MKLHSIPDHDDEKNQDTLKEFLNELMELFSNKRQFCASILKYVKSYPSRISEIKESLKPSENDEHIKSLLSTALKAQKKVEAAKFAKKKKERANLIANATAGKYTGIIISWNHEKGFGKIRRDKIQGDAHQQKKLPNDLFIHHREVMLGEGDHNPKVTSSVEFDIGSQDGKDNVAIHCCGIGGVECESGRSVGTIARTVNGNGTITPDNESGDASADIPFSKEDLWELPGTLQAGSRVNYDPVMKVGQGQFAVYITEENTGVHLDRKYIGANGINTDEEEDKETTSISEELKEFAHCLFEKYATKRAMLMGILQYLDSCSTRTVDIVQCLLNQDIDNDIEQLLDADWKTVQTATSIKGARHKKNVGVIEKWVAEKGYGFIRHDDGEGIFVHIQDMKLKSSDRGVSLKLKQRVEFKSRTRNGKVQASKVTAFGGGYCECEEQIPES